jgi:hypothetical protein
LIRGTTKDEEMGCGRAGLLPNPDNQRTHKVIFTTFTYKFFYHKQEGLGPYYALLKTEHILLESYSVMHIIFIFNIL